MNKIFTAAPYNWIHVAIKYIKRKIKLTVIYRLRFSLLK